MGGQDRQGDRMEGQDRQGGGYLHTLVVAVSDEDATTGRGGDSLQVGELSLVPSLRP